MDELPDWTTQQQQYTIWSFHRWSRANMIHTKVLRLSTAFTIAASGRCAKFSSHSGVKLKSLTSLQLCQLFEHSHIYNLGGFIFQNKLTGTSSLLAIQLLSCSSKQNHSICNATI